MLANLDTGTATDRQAVAELSISNATLTHELRKATATIATLQQRLTSCVCASNPRTGGKGQKQRQQNPSRDFTPLDPDGYCWSYGYHVSRGLEFSGVVSVLFFLSLALERMYNLLDAVAALRLSLLLSFIDLSTSDKIGRASLVDKEFID